MAYEVNMTQMNVSINLTQNFVAVVQRAQQSLDGLGQKAIETSQKVNESSKALGFGEKLSNGLNTARQAIGEVGNSTAGFLKDCIDGASKSEKINKDLEQTIKSTGGAAGFTAQEVGKMASQLSNTSTFSTGAIKSGQSMLLTFTNIGKDVFPMASQAMVDMAQKMGTEPVEASKLLGKALSDPTKGLSDLNGIGIRFTDEQKKQVEAMQKAEDAAGAQKIILSELNKEFGGQAAAASETYDGKMKKLSTTISAIKGSIGDALLPYVEKAADAFLKIAQKVKDVPKPIMDLIAKFLGVVAIVGPVIGGTEALKKTFEKLCPSISGIGDVFGKLNGPIGIIIIALAALSYAYTNNIGGFKTFVDNSIPKVEEVFKSLFNFIQEHGPEIKTVLAGIVGGVSAYKLFQGVIQGVSKAMNLWSNATKLVSIAQAALNLVMSANPVVKIIVFIGALIGILIYLWNTNESFRNAVIGVWNSISSFFSTVINGIKGFFTGLVDHIKKIPASFSAFKNSIYLHIVDLKNKISSALNSIKTFVVNVFIGIKKSVMNTIQPFINWIINTFNNMKTKLSNALNGIRNIFQGIWNTLANLCKTIWNSMLNTISSVLNNIGNFIRNVWNGIVGFFKSLVNTLYNAGVSIFTGLRNGISNILNTLGNIIQTGFNTAISFLQSLPGKALEWGSDFIKGLINGIKSQIGGIVDVISGVADKIKSFLHFSVPDQGPLTDYETWMPDFMKGMGNGIKVNTRLVTDPVKDLSVGIKTNMNGTLSGGGKSGSLGLKGSINTTKNDSTQNGLAITIAKLADSIVIREEGDIDKIATALANKLTQTALGMG